MMAFGQEWINEDALKRTCSAVCEMAESPNWLFLESLASMLIQNQKDKFMHTNNFEEVREIVGVVRGIEKLLALPAECSSVLKQDETRKE